jgi:hypothetical protein
MTYACPAWEFAAETHLLKFQRLQNNVLRTTGKLQRSTPVRDFHIAFQDHENENVRYIGQGEVRHRKYKRLKLGGGHVYDRSSV